MFYRVLGLLLCLSVAVGAQNLLVDSGFEFSGQEPDLAPWVARGSQTSIAVGQGRAGEDGQPGFAARLRPRTDFGAEWMQPLLPLTVGKEYIVSAWVRRGGAETVQVSLGVRTQKGYQRIFRHLNSDDWQQLELAFTGDTGWAQVVLSSMADVTVYWDDVVLYELDTVMEELAQEWQERLQTDAEPLYTGLIIDARGTGLERGMSPRIYDAAGYLVFSGMDISQDQLIQHGIVAYARSLEAATAHPRVAVNPDYPMRLPLVIDAQQATGSPPTAVVVGREDGQRIRRAIDQYDFLDKFAVIFVVD